MESSLADDTNPADQLAQLAALADWDAAVAVGLRFLGGGQEDGNLFMRMASLLLDARMIDAAEACIREGCIRWPTYSWLFWQYARLATGHRAFEVAQTRWQDLMARHPELPHGLSGLADLHRIHRREDDAARLFAEAVARYPDYVWAAHGDATTATVRNDWREAARRWTTVRDRFPDHIPAHVQLAHALMEDERLAEAEEAARTGLAASPQDPSLAAVAARIAERKRERSVEFFVCSAFQNLLQRDPQPDESAHWVKLIQEGLPEREFFRRMVNSHDYKWLHPINPGHPPGHFYSPVVDPTEAAEYWRRSKAVEIPDLSGIDLDIGEMEEFWHKNADFMLSMQFARGPGGRTRYYWDNGMYPVRDAMVLAGMINQYRPRRIIEVGSGFSTATILDTVDRLELRELDFTSIDPDASTLHSFVGPADRARVKIIESKVQDVPVATFAELRAGDILLLDSTHVMKTGSDVNYELFSVLPALQPGVIIHFHDIDFPFEYHEKWVFENRWSWNEAYALRAFLSYNSAFRVIFFTDLFFKQHGALTEAATSGLFDHPWRLLAPGGSLWIVREN
jgi:tetratricopeptide (TPR) repeat protein